MKARSGSLSPEEQLEVVIHISGTLKANEIDSPRCPPSRILAHGLAVERPTYSQCLVSSPDNPDLIWYGARSCLLLNLRVGEQLFP